MRARSTWLRVGGTFDRVGLRQPEAWRCAGGGREGDVIVENQLGRVVEEAGTDFEALRAANRRCGVFGDGVRSNRSVGDLPSHGLNMDALGDTLNVIGSMGSPNWGDVHSWGNELGATYAAMAVCAAVLSAK